MRRSLLPTFPLALLTILLLAAPGIAERGDDADRASKNGSTTGTIDGVEVEIEYGRPNVKGREIWGGLVPYDEVWRTGANEATTISFSGDVLIDGETLPAGLYGLFTVPGVEKWTVIFNETADQWGSGRYDAAKDVLRVTVEPAVGDQIESMEFVIDGERVVLRWEKLEVGFSVSSAG